MKKRELKLGAAIAAVAIAVSVAGCAKKDAAADKQEFFFDGDPAPHTSSFTSFLPYMRHRARGASK